MELTAKVGGPLVGVRILDCDHREMFEAITDLKARVQADEDPRRTSSLLRRLARFTQSHFSLEDGMMAATKFPGATPHRLHHQNLMRQIRELVSRSRRGELGLNGQSLSMLEALHVDHVEEDDVSYGHWLNGEGRN